MIGAIIVEYNPLHNGHILHIKKTRELMEKISHSSENYLIAIMSGGFVERGEVAILNKYTRATHAICSGVDMVIELPSIFATSSASYFAKGAIDIARKIKGLEMICFGSECGDIEKLKNIINISESKEYNSLVKENMDKGLSYPISTALALESLGIRDNTEYSLPNNTLGIEYIKEAKKVGLEDIMYTIKREGGGYHDITTQSEYISATAIRHSVSNNSIEKIENKLPSYVLKDLFNSHIDYDKLFGIVTSKVLTLDNVYEDNEGVINRIKKFSQIANNYEELISLSHTKRYTKSKIKRILLHIALNHSKDMIREIGNINILAIKESSKHLLSLIEKSEDNYHIENDNYSNKIYNIVSKDKITSESMRIIK